jgi:hypothetical protein
LPSAQTRIEAVLEATGADYHDQKRRQAAFLRKTTTGRLRKDYADPTDLRIQVLRSLTEHFKNAQPKEAAARLHPPEILPSLCNRGPQVDAFGEAFQSGKPGRPELYVIHGHEHEQHKRCVQRLVCFHINYPKKRSAGALVVPPDPRSIVQWPGEEDEQEILFNRLCRRLFQAVDQHYAFPQGYAVSAFCRLLLDSKASYVRFRHVLRPENWDASAQQLCANFYLKFWSDVYKTFSGLAAGETPPRMLVFFEFKHRFTDRQSARDFHTGLKQIFEKSPAGEGLVRRVLPELPPVELEDLDAWYDCYEQFLMPEFRGQPVADLFPDTPLPMMQAETRLRRLLGMENHAD